MINDNKSTSLSSETILFIITYSEMCLIGTSGITSLILGNYGLSLFSASEIETLDVKAVEVSNSGITQKINKVFWINTVYGTLSITDFKINNCISSISMFYIK